MAAGTFAEHEDEDEDAERFRNFAFCCMLWLMRERTDAARCASASAFIFFAAAGSDCTVRSTCLASRALTASSCFRLRIACGDVGTFIHDVLENVTVHVALCLFLCFAQLKLNRATIVETFEAVRVAFVKYHFLVKSE